ncbi:oligopeptidase B Serine peptidase. MEROPS family S09A [Flavobacterium micromati]|uniref:prolyl oligopeptidase n=1 Tax=Flavobacterium micromati TaxID=229205 RepID=A0A1M5IMH9_9FLAO|nr:prolyl oligopeptidase family serine peptidase [Flavobacterium micromati]SHG29455.1 oligopeptidase B Serine peptidase. MEROPS family S09A [Flavobacterium micromati]
MKKIITSSVLLLFGSTLFAQWNYPKTKMEIVSDTYFGVTYNDPYRWLEDLKDPNVISWFKDQADLTNTNLSKISGRDELIAEWKKLDKLQPAVYYSPIKENGKIFYQKRMPGEKVSKVYYREQMQGAEQLLFDPLTFIPGKTLSVQQIIPSYDGRKLVIAYSERGAEVSTIQVMNVDTKQFLPDIIMAIVRPGSWTFDNNAFTYMWIKSADNTDPTSRLNPKTKLHKLGTNVNSDIDFFSNETYPALKIESKVYPYAFFLKDSKEYIFAREGTVQREKKFYYAPIAQLHSGNIQWKPLSTLDDKLVRSADMHGDKMYAITHNGAKNYKLITTDLKKPNWATAKIIGPEKETQTLESFTRSKDYLLLTYSDGINNQIYKYNTKDLSSTEVKLPFTGLVNISCMDTKTNDFFIAITSWNKPLTEFLFDANTNSFSDSPFNKPALYPDSYKNLVVEEVEVKGHDGVMIPLTIIYKKGLKKDGSNVCLMDAYGAYGISMSPYFSVRLNSMAVKGVVIAIPHVRGGSEKGQDWYKAGYKTTKPNTWKDFISCGEYLVAQGYTSPSKLAGTGTSAGGILITRAITERPDLFAAAICNVGVANAMRVEFSSNGPANIPEFGTVKDETECKALYEMDGMQHVNAGVKYPAVICIAGWNDPRVVAWQPGKFAAAVQNTSTSGKPVLMKINYDNGHFTEDKDVTFANFADQYAFALWQCGHPDFQLKK